eukprot:1117928-Alexandrium_andersonii.AAC.1
MRSRRSRRPPTRQGRHIRPQPQTSAGACASPSKLPGAPGQGFAEAPIGQACALLLHTPAP